MRTYLDCIPCFFKQSLKAARIAGADDPTQKKLLDTLSRHVPDFSISNSPPEMGRVIYKLVREITGNNDPYKNFKEKYNKIALDLYPILKEKVSSSKDPLLAAIRLAITGNVIDFGPFSSFDIKKEIEINQEKTFAIFDYKKFVDALGKCTEEILYLADNAGEVVFDRVLIEELAKRDEKVVYAVKEHPVINDALFEDAIACGIDKVAEIISSGSDAPGTVLSTCSKEFLKIYDKAQFVISKGLGNYEALSSEKKTIFFLLKAKCPVVARDIGCNVNDIVLKGGAS